MVAMGGFPGSAGTAPAPAETGLTVEQVRVHLDHMGREVITVPDEVAVRLRQKIDAGWTEIPGVADGYSRPFALDSWVGRVTDTILAAYAASPVPDGIDDKPRNRGWSDVEAAQRSRERAGKYHYMGVFIVGESAWDEAGRWWAHDVRDPQHKRLSVHANPTRVTRGGRECVEWGG